MTSPFAPMPHTPPAEVFASARFQVMQTRVASPGHPAFDYTYIVPRNGVVVLPVLADGRLVLIQNQRLPVQAVLWELPAGVIEPGEDPQVAAKRELEEETGYQPEQLAELPSLFTSPGLATEKQHVFVATGLTQVGRRLDAGENMRAHALPMAQVLDMAKRGAIQDARTLAAVLWWARFGPDCPA